MSKNVTLIILFSIAALLVGTYTYYNYTLPPLEEVYGPPVAVASVFPVYDIARNIAGDTTRVKLLLPPGASPHTFEPTPAILKEMQGADVLYTIGYGADDWATGLLTELGVTAVTVDENINLREFGAHDEEDEHDHEGIDPHYWLSTTNAMQIARTIAADMTNRWPEQTADIEENLENYLSRLEQADQKIRQTLQNVENRQIVTLHDAWYYFAEEYGLEVAASFAPTPGREPTPQYLATLGRAVDESGVKVIYSEPQLSTDALLPFTADHGIEIVVLDPLGGVPERDTYIKTMLYNAETIAQIR